MEAGTWRSRRVLASRPSLSSREALSSAAVSRICMAHNKWLIAESIRIEAMPLQPHGGAVQDGASQRNVEASGNLLLAGTTLQVGAA